MTQSLDRLIFVLKTKLRVAYINYTVERVFNPIPVLKKQAIIAAVSVLLLLSLAGAVLSKNILIGESKASIPLVSDAPLVKTDLTRIEKDLENIAVIPDEPVIEARFTIAVDKYSRTLFVFKENGDYFEVVEKYGISLGEILGEKEQQGDLKTPEGYYKVVKIKEKEELDKIYGPRAFVLNYPNQYDLKNGRSGGGIWIHGSGQGKRTPDTKGCVELDDSHIIALGKWIDINTPIAIFPADFPLPVVDDKLDKRYLIDNFFYGDLVSTPSG